MDNDSVAYSAIEGTAREASSLVDVDGTMYTHVSSHDTAEVMYAEGDGNPASAQNTLTYTAVGLDEYVIVTSESVWLLGL